MGVYASKPSNNVVHCQQQARSL